MKTVLLAGGSGSRLSEATSVLPKPMIEIGPRPIIWHIMKTYAHCGFNDFIICCGYKGAVIKDYFLNYCYHSSDITIGTCASEITVHNSPVEDWSVTLCDTGVGTLTTDRLSLIRPRLLEDNDDNFMLTYGDGVGSVDINALVQTHVKSGKTCTITVVKPEGRFGIVGTSSDGTITSFQEKPSEEAWVNAGFMVIRKDIFEELDKHPGTMLEDGPIPSLVRQGRAGVYHHTGFWQCMDTLRDKAQLEDMWNRGNAPWKV